MIRLLKNIYLPGRFFILFGGVALLFTLSFAFSALFPVAQAALVFGVVMVLVDVLLLFRFRMPVLSSRTGPRVMSLGSDNAIKLRIENKSSMSFKTTIIDELPMQLQQRDFLLKLKLTAGEKRTLNYVLKPLVRGEYFFGDINIYVRSAMGLVERRIRQEQKIMIPVYPSIIQMKQFELMSVAKISTYQGIKRMRRLGHSYEFEQIKNYVRGDDYRSINWKATGRKRELMVNQFVDERAQQIYSVIDNSRSMRMPFGGLSLLDHAVNTSLVISNVALHKQDKAGLLIFSDKISTVLKAEGNRTQLKKILENLYKCMRNNIKGRSLIFLYTNFESFYAMERVLPILRKLNKLHLLVVVFFENTEIAEYSQKSADNTEGIYFQTIAQLFVSEKKQMVQMLSQYGIQAILSRPEDLSINAINKYLELKSRGMI